MNAFKNTYYIMRHGQSEANVAGLIVSDPAIGCHQYGLTSEGQHQVQQAVESFSGSPPTHIICSDFLRTRETAALAAKGFKLAAPTDETGLRERFFGTLEGKPDHHYPDVWRADEAGIANEHNVESVDQVLARGLATLDQLEQTYENQVLLLVSHGDMLQILQTAFAGFAAREHRQLPHHQTAEIKLLVAKGAQRP